MVVFEHHRHSISELFLPASPIMFYRLLFTFHKRPLNIPQPDNFHPSMPYFLLFYNEFIVVLNLFHGRI